MKPYGQGLRFLRRSGLRKRTSRLLMAGALRCGLTAYGQGSGFQGGLLKTGNAELKKP